MDPAVADEEQPKGHRARPAWRGSSGGRAGAPRARGPAGVPFGRVGLDVRAVPHPARGQRLDRFGEPPAVDVGDHPALVPADDLGRLRHPRQRGSDLDQECGRPRSRGAQEARLVDGSPQPGQATFGRAGRRPDLGPIGQRGRPPAAPSRRIEARMSITGSIAGIVRGTSGDDTGWQKSNRCSILGAFPMRWDNLRLVDPAPSAWDDHPAVRAGRRGADVRHARVQGHDVLRGPGPLDHQPGARRVAGPVPVDDQPVPRMHAMHAFTASLATPTPISTSTPARTSTRRSW